MSILCQDPSKSFVDVAVIGNGPSAICLSYFLSGYRPYYNGRPHSDIYLHEKLNKIHPDVSILEQELDYLCDGLEGRSSNPVAVLFDALTHPDADFGADNPSLLDWKQDNHHAINHVVLGKMKPGGSWQSMDGSMQTLSLSSWMELPDLPFHDWLRRHRSVEEPIEPVINRATITDVCNYYMSFVKEKNLTSNFLDYHVVTSVQKVYHNNKMVHDETGETEPCCPNMAKHQFHWEVRGYRLVHPDQEEAVNMEPVREDFCISALNVVVATGTFDIPNKLGITGENQPYVSHSLHELESVINNEQLSTNSDPLLVVGAGLSAADAILIAIQQQVPVFHVFRRGANDSTQVLKKLPQNMYPEYHEVHSLMKGSHTNPLYKPLPKHDLVELTDDKRALIRPHKKKDGEITTIDVSHVAILIGSRPDLTYLPQGGRDLGIMRRYPIENKHNPIDIDPYTYQCVNEPGLFAMGPLVGDNFVRFGLGGALGITHFLSKRET